MLHQIHEYLFLYEFSLYDFKNRKLYTNNCLVIGYLFKFIQSMNFPSWKKLYNTSQCYWILKKKEILSYLMFIVISNLEIRTWQIVYKYEFSSKLNISYGSAMIY